MKEKMIIAMEVENFPEGTSMLDFRLLVLEDGLISKVFKSWKKVSYKRVQIKNMEVVKK